MSKLLTNKGGFLLHIRSHTTDSSWESALHFLKFIPIGLCATTESNTIFNRVRLKKKKKEVLTTMPLCVYPPPYISVMFASGRRGTQLALISKKATSRIPNMHHDISFTLHCQPGPATRCSTDTSQTLLTPIRESIELHRRHSCPDFDACWLGRYITC